MTRQGWKYTYNETTHQIQRRTKSKDGSSSPEERERLGTEDSGFGGDNVSGVVGLLIDAANDDESLRQNCDSGIRLNSLKNIFDSGEKEMKSKEQFELSDDESLFSSGYAFSIDLPSSDLLTASESRHSLADRCQNLPIGGEEFGFENINKQQLELEIASEFVLANKNVVDGDFQGAKFRKSTANGQGQGTNPLTDCTSNKLTDRNGEPLNESNLLGDEEKGLMTQKSLKAIRSFKPSKP